VLAFIAPLLGCKTSECNAAGLAPFPHNSATNGKKPEAYRILNSLNQAFVDTVRVSGSNNAGRFLLIAGYWADIDNTCDPLFAMPQDTLDGRLILSVHYYTPATFCIIEKDESWGKNRRDWGSRADYDELSAQFAKIRAHFIDKGIPVILGEYGVAMNNKAEADRVKWMTAVTQACLDNGICPALWGTDGEIKRRPPFAMSDSLAKVLKALVMRN
jgi:endoglucanase